MNANDPISQEEQMTTLFTAGEEALAAGKIAGQICPPGTPDELRPRLEQNLACAKLLRQALGRPAVNETRVPLPGLPQQELPTIVPVPSDQQRPIPQFGPQTDNELRTLLHKRLRFISLTVTAVYALNTVVSFYSVVFQTQLFMEHLWEFLVGWLVASLVFLLTGVLWANRALSFRRLRGIEVLFFGVVLANFLWGFWDELFVQHRLRPFLEHPDGFFASDAPWNYFSSWLLPFTLLIVGYGVLIPSSWRRCTCIVGAMALLPLLLLSVHGLHEGGRMLGFLGFVLPVLMLYLAIPSAIAIFGAHRIEILRQEAIEARRLGQYRLKHRLGSGGMGEVYLAEHVLLKQPCAIKLIRPERAGDPSNLRRFEREVQATARLKHWNTVQVYDYGHAADGTFYYAMEYLPGLNLDDLVKRHGPLPPERAIHLLRQVCSALNEAHGIGLIHRDIKPSNIIACERAGMFDVAKLLDFGLVRSYETNEPTDHLTQEGTVAGTPAYMSPEQADGKKNLDVRTDIYSLGAVAYYLLTGQPPFIRPTAMQTLLAHLCDPPTPLDQLRPDVPADLQAVVLTCLEKDPARRFTDARALDNALAGCRAAGGWSEQDATAWWRKTTTHPDR